MNLVEEVRKIKEDMSPKSPSIQEQVESYISEVNDLFKFGVMEDNQAMALGVHLFHRYCGPSSSRLYESFKGTVVETQVFSGKFIGKDLSSDEDVSLISNEFIDRFRNGKSNE